MMEMGFILYSIVMILMGVAITLGIEDKIEEYKSLKDEITNDDVLTSETEG